MIWISLIGAIAAEVCATLSLRIASQPEAAKGWWAAVAAGYLTALGLLMVCLYGGMAIGVAYGIWAACGVALTAVAGRVLFKEPLTKVMALGIGMVVAGVLLVELGAH